ncbi:recombinase family protein [Kordiimonas pumila]|uniref:Recombinase family protein n=1 Tax=Kordiimonas pumila TaxID=2161677 RepID=A0ABV7D625_9PROT|nr:recombinase family protein [Kordiimonas pumila]
MKNTIAPHGDAPAHPLKAAQYVRMSTEHQQYSTQNQSKKIQEYAAQRHIEIVKTYADEGKSGLSIGGRAALQRLISDVEAGDVGFNIILVYDISRWGRFQDADESAYYEYICRRSGIQVTYCAEQFENDGSPVSTIVKGVKRAMAGEYSRELSAKVFAGQCRLIELGYRQGGPAGFGLRRVLVDQSGKEKGELAPGEHKSLQTDRVILVPGPSEEVEVVNKMFQWLLTRGVSITEIANRLNERGIKTNQGKNWTYATVRQVLTNEKYIGNNVFNRRSFKLKQKHVNNPSDMWIRKEGAFEAIVPRDIFQEAQEVLQSRSRRYSDEELLDNLRTLYSKIGTLSAAIINAVPDMPGAATYHSRFGGLVRAYSLVGYRAVQYYHITDIRRLNKSLRPQIIEQVQSEIENKGGLVFYDQEVDLLHVNQELLINLVLARCHVTDAGLYRWFTRVNSEQLRADITVAVRLDPANQAELDYFLLPRCKHGREIYIHNRNVAVFDRFRFDSLAALYELVERASVTE